MFSIKENQHFFPIPQVKAAQAKLWNNLSAMIIFTININRKIANQTLNPSFELHSQ